jgi:hypothetical protein
VGGVRYNPLFEIRRGPGEVRDPQTIAEILIDPEGKGDKDHWRLTGAALLTGVILHLLHGERDKTLRGVSAFLSDPARSLHETFHPMLVASHLPTGTHPVVAQTARAMLNKSANELSGVVSTAKAVLTLRGPDRRRQHGVLGLSPGRSDERGAPGVALPGVSAVGSRSHPPARSVAAQPDGQAAHREDCRARPGAGGTGIGLPILG